MMNMIHYIKWNEIGCIYALLLSISVLKVVKQHLCCEIKLFDGLNYFHGVKVLIQWKTFGNFFSNNSITGQLIKDFKFWLQIVTDSSRGIRTSANETS